MDWWAILRSRQCFDGSGMLTDSLFRGLSAPFLSIQITIDIKDCCSRTHDLSKKSWTDYATHFYRFADSVAFVTTGLIKLNIVKTTSFQPSTLEIRKSHRSKVRTFCWLLQRCHVVQGTHGRAHISDVCENLENVTFLYRFISFSLVNSPHYTKQ